ncbi:MAG: hypothetical protein MIO92_13535 [Methanosarcinaceae archaeon]|nr:hypothetical protein [Methanosarcinaceae archaeon]
MRNGLAEQALEAGAEYLFFVDDDVIGPLKPDGTDIPSLLTLLAVAEHFNHKFVSGLYWAKKNQAHKSLAAWKKVDAPTTGNEAWAGKRYTYAAITDNQLGRYVMVDAVGMGFALIHRSMFEQLPRPWFEWKVGGVSEDFYFCEQAAEKLQIAPLVDMELKCSHIGTYKVLPDGSFELLQM